MSACVKFLDCGIEKEIPEEAAETRTTGILHRAKDTRTLVCFFSVTEAVSSAAVSPLFRDHLATSQSPIIPCFVCFFPLQQWLVKAAHTNCSSVMDSVNRNISCEEIRVEGHTNYNISYIRVRVSNVSFEKLCVSVVVLSFILKFLPSCDSSYSSVHRLSLPAHHEIFACYKSWVSVQMCRKF